jgi:thymidylate synthase
MRALLYLNNIVTPALYQRVFWRGVVEELLWFISGSTNAKVLLKYFAAYVATISPFVSSA